MHSRVIRLPEVAVETGRAGGHDNATILLLLERCPGRLRALEAALQVHIVHQVPVLVRDAGETAIAQDSRIIDQNIDATEAVQSRLDDLLAVDHRIVVGDRNAT